MGLLFSNDIAVLDVTSRLISAIVGAKKAQSVFFIKSIVEKPNQGYENGEWFDKEDTAAIAGEVIKEAMKAANSRTKRLFVGVPAEFCTVVTKDVAIDLDRRRRIVDDDIEYLYRKGNTFDDMRYITIDHSAIYFRIEDGGRMLNDVRGLDARFIEASVCYILAERSFVDMFDKIAKDLGFTDVCYISTQWAECINLLEHEQRDATYALIDVGYLSSSVAIAKGEGILQMRSFSMGGGHIAADIFEFLNVPFEMAEDAKKIVDIKREYSEDAILVGDGENNVYAVDAAAIVKNRLNMFADIIAQVLDGFEGAPAYIPIYIAGEGIAPMRGAIKYLSEQLSKGIEVINPKLPGFVRIEDNTKAALLMMADTLVKASRNYIFSNDKKRRWR